MQTLGPYRLLEVVGTCEVGRVWSAVDDDGRRFTVAALEPAAASSQGWRDAFVATAHALSQAQDDALPIVHADYAGATPWVACAQEQGHGAGQIFRALGLQYQLVGAPQPTQGRERTTEAAAQPTLAQPVQPQPARAQPVPAASTVPAPIAPAAVPPPRPAQPAPAPVNPFAGPGPTKRTRRGLRARWVLVVAVLFLAVGVAGGAIGITLRPDLVTYLPVQAHTSVSTVAPSNDIGLPSAKPTGPGQEPPQGGGWPRQWPHFADTERTTEQRNLAGIFFTFRVPEGWQCSQTERRSGFARYACGRGQDIGGDLVVRECPVPCTEERRSEMRRLEEAWGVKWTRSGQFTTWGETFQVDGAARYGLVYVSYWRSVAEEGIDRQLVFRMTAPVGDADVLRKVVNSIRDATITV